MNRSIGTRSMKSSAVTCSDSTTSMSLKRTMMRQATSRPMATPPAMRRTTLVWMRTQRWEAVVSDAGLDSGDAAPFMPAEAQLVEDGQLDHLLMAFPTEVKLGEVMAAAGTGAPLDSRDAALVFPFEVQPAEAELAMAFPAKA